MRARAYALHPITLSRPPVSFRLSERRKEIHPGKDHLWKPK